MKSIKIPKKYLALVGTKQILAGCLFSRKKYEDNDEYDVLDIRMGMAKIVNSKELIEKGTTSIEHPTFELLIKNHKMSRSRWTRPFPIREINLKQIKGASTMP